MISVGKCFVVAWSKLILKEMADLERRTGVNNECASATRRLRISQLDLSTAQRPLEAQEDDMRRIIYLAELS